MTRMTPLDDHDAPDQDLYEEAPPRSIFAATWFRALLVLIVLGVVGAVAVPYILDAMNPPPTKQTAASRATPASPPAVSTPPAPPPATSSAVTSSSPPASTSSLPPTTAAPALTDKATDTKPALADKSDKSDKTEKIEKVTKVEKTAKPVEKSDRADRVGDDKMVASATTTDAPKPAATKPAAKAAPKPSTTAKSDTPKGEESAAPAAATKPAPTPTKRVAAKATPPSAPKAAESGDWWVQVGAFKDAETAKKVAAKLREQNYKVDESVRSDSESASTKSTGSDKPAAAAPVGTDQYDVFVAGGSTADLNKRLSGKGLAAEASGAGVVIRPSLPLRDAVALSKDLAIEGFKVQVRRAGGTEAASARTATAEKPSAALSSADGLHRVRVGGYSDRAAAMVALKELEGKGYKPFLTRR
jgi:cell division septation protein DedD